MGKSFRRFVFLCALILLIYFIWFYEPKKEGFSTKPTPDQVNLYTDQILKNKSLFNTNLYNAQKTLPWLDGIVYEDIRRKLYHNNLNEKTIAEIFGSKL